MRARGRVGATQLAYVLHQVLLPSVPARADLALAFLFPQRKHRRRVAGMNWTPVRVPATTMLRDQMSLVVWVRIGCGALLSSVGSRAGDEWALLRAIGEVIMVNGLWWLHFSCAPM